MNVDAAMLIRAGGDSLTLYLTDVAVPHMTQRGGHVHLYSLFLAHSHTLCPDAESAFLLEHGSAPGQGGRRCICARGGAGTVLKG